jgi:hypothetical protein
VLLAPGALVFRIVDHPGSWRNERAEWIVKQRGRHRPARQNPTRECVKDVYSLRKFLGKRGLESVPVYAIVVFTSPNLELSAADPVVPICEVRLVPRAGPRVPWMSDRTADDPQRRRRDHRGLTLPRSGRITDVVLQIHATRRSSGCCSWAPLAAPAGPGRVRSRVRACT